MNVLDNAILRPPIDFTFSEVQEYKSRLNNFYNLIHRGITREDALKKLDLKANLIIKDIRSLRGRVTVTSNPIITEIFESICLEIKIDPLEKVIGILDPLLAIFREKNLREVFNLVAVITSPEVTRHFFITPKDSPNEVDGRIAEKIRMRKSEIARLPKLPIHSNYCLLSDTFDQINTIADARDLLFQVCNLKEVLDFLISEKDFSIQAHIHSEIDELLVTKKMIDNRIDLAIYKLQEVVDRGVSKKISSEGLKILGAKGTAAVNLLQSSAKALVETAEAQIAVLNAFRERIEYRLKDDRLGPTSRGVLPLNRIYQKM